MVRPVTEEDTGLKELYSPEADASATTIDVVAIHGLGAHPDDTWSKNGANWLSDQEMLPAVIPEARILRYGYESAWFGPDAMRQRVSTVAKRLLLTLRRKRKDCPFRPLIFIAHCFGGLVVLKALLDAKEDEDEWPGLFKSITGLVFFGTPFRGAEGLEQSEILEAALQDYGPDQIQGDVLQILQAGNEFLQELVDKFGKTRSQAHKSQIACFYELKSSNVGAIVGKQQRIRFVVNETSGCLDLSESTEKYSLSRTHFNMNKFGKPTGEDFQTVHEVIEKMAKEAPKIVLARSTDFGRYQIPFNLDGIPRVKKFVDRPADIAPIERALLSTEHNSRQKIFVLRGLGGIGKTQLAFEFARRHHQKFSSVFWVDGRNEDSVKRSIARHAASVPTGQIPEISRSYLSRGSVDVDTVVKDVMGWLKQPDNSSWLLIFDNVDLDYNQRPADPGAYDVRRFLSGADHGSVLITTRLARLEQLGEPHELRKVDTAQAWAILDIWYKRERDIAETGELLDRLDGLPLAIAQAGAYLQESGIDIRTYLQFYDEEWQDLFETQDEDEPPLEDYEDRSIWTTWSISYNAIRKKNEAAANLLLLWSYLDNKDLWHGMFAAACEICAIAAQCLSEWIGDVANREIKFVQAMKLLQNYSLVESGSDKGSYSTHPVVHRWAYHYRARTFQSELRQLALLSVGWAVPDRSARDLTAMRRRLLPHAQACTRWVVPRQTLYSESLENSNTDSTRPKQEVAMLEAIYYLGFLYVVQGNMAGAERMYTQALQGQEKVLGLKHKSTLNTVNGLGVLYRLNGKPADAYMMFTRVLQEKETLGSKHTLILHTVGDLGALYHDQGNLANAEMMFARALQGYEETLEPNDSFTLGMKYNLGNLYRGQGRLADAEMMYARALQGYEETIGPKHPETLDTLNNLGGVYYEQDKLADAEAMYTRALEGKEEALGLKHISTLDTVNNLGCIYEAQGKLADAEAMYTRALEGEEEALGLKHTSTLHTVNNLGNLYSAQGKLADAEAMYTRALQGYEKASGPTHTLTLSTVNNLGCLYRRQGKLADAEAMYTRALQGYEEAFKERVTSHISALKTMKNLGNILEETKREGAAKEMYTKALSGYANVQGPASDKCQDLERRLETLRLAFDGSGIVDH
ncbi:MAG: hypothetical protein M1821_004096 [Bathelium mastoideum]|nr:MAG: hypothetical protein M1821_004096 [Bathelium mastoideum]